MSIRQFRPMTAGTRFRVGVRIRRDHPGHAGEVAAGADEEDRAAATTRATSRRGTGAAGTSGSTGRSTSSANKFGIPGRVAEIEYDPNRTARIALIVYADGEKRYILHPKGLAQGDTVVSGPGPDTRTGNALPLGEIPLGTNGAQHRAQDRQGRPAGAARRARARRWWRRRASTSPCGSAPPRCAWCTAAASPRSARSATPSTSCSRSARRARPAGCGKRPKVRGVAMNPVDHPLGGGEGKSSGGRPPMSPWGKPEGAKTRQRKKASDQADRARTQARQGDQR